MAVNNKTIEQQRIRMKALGRHFQLGELYNYRNDRIPTDDWLGWNSNELVLSSVRVTQKFELELVSCSNSVRTVKNHSNVWENMELDNHLLISTWAGLIQNYRGASNYLNRKCNVIEVTHTLIVRLTTKTESLDLPLLLMKNEKGSLPCFDARRVTDNATHVIAGVSSGAEAYCVLAQEFNKEFNNQEEIEKKLSLIAKQMKCALENNKSLKDFKILLKKEGNKILDHLKCRLYSDLQKEPVRECSVIDAYSHCFDLINKIQKPECASKAIPISVQLCPIKVIANHQLGQIEKFSGLFESRDVDAKVVQRCCRLLADWERIEAKVDAVEIAVIQSYRASVRQFSEMFIEFQKLFKKTLNTKIEEARQSNDIEIENLIAIAENHKLFGTSRLENWLKYKSADSELISKMSKVKEAIFFASRDNLMQKLFQFPLSTFSLVLNVPRLGENTSKILHSMENHLAASEILTEVDFDEEQDEQRWHSYNEIRKQVLEKIRQLCDHANINRHLEDRLQLFITFHDNVKEFTSCYSSYRGGGLLQDNLECLPGPPTGVRVRLTTSADVQNAGCSFFFVEWVYESVVGFHCRFLVQHRLKGNSETWIEQKITKYGQTWIEIKLDSDWTDSSVMEFRVATYTCIGQSDFSDVIDTESAGRYSKINLKSPVKRKYPEAKSSQPVKTIRKVTLSPALSGLTADLITEDSAELEWSPILGIPFRFLYRIQYRKDGSQLFQLDVNSEETSCRLVKLEPGTTYSVNIVAVSEDGREISEQSETLKLTTIKKEFRFAETILNDCLKIGNRNEMDLYLVPLVEMTAPSDQRGQTFQRFVFGQADPQNKNLPHKTILLLGTAGCDKSNLINGMINYIFNVKWKHPFRFQLIRDDVEGSSSNPKMYLIFHKVGMRIPFSLRIIDVPCFDDAVKIYQISNVIRQLEQNDIKKLHFICLVTQASQSTPSRIKLFQTILSNFGKNVKQNIDFFLTLTDSPQVLNSIVEEGLLCSTDNETGIPLFHRFNHSGFFSSNRVVFSKAGVDTKKGNNQIIWQMDMSSFKSFFSLLDNVESKSLSLTKQVLDEKKQLDLKVNGLAALVETCYSKMEEFSHKKKSVTVSRVEIEKKRTKKGFPIKVKLPVGKYSNVCTDCFFSCHYPCASKMDQYPSACEIMDHSKPPKSRTCRVCPRKCHWRRHSFKPYKVIYVPRTKENFRKIDKGNTQVAKNPIVEQQIKILEKEVENNEKIIQEEIQAISRHIQQLETIALLIPKPMSTLQYIDQLIDVENQKKRQGFLKRNDILIRLYNRTINQVRFPDSNKTTNNR